MVSWKWSRKQTFTLVLFWVPVRAFTSPSKMFNSFSSPTWQMVWGKQSPIMATGAWGFIISTATSFVLARSDMNMRQWSHWRSTWAATDIKTPQFSGPVKGWSKRRSPMTRCCTFPFAQNRTTTTYTSATRVVPSQITTKYLPPSSKTKARSSAKRTTGMYALIWERLGTVPFFIDLVNRTRKGVHSSLFKLIPACQRVRSKAVRSTRSSLARD